MRGGGERAVVFVLWKINVLEGDDEVVLAPVLGVEVHAVVGAEFERDRVAFALEKGPSLVSSKPVALRQLAKVAELRKAHGHPAADSLAAGQGSFPRRIEREKKIPGRHVSRCLSRAQVLRGKEVEARRSGRRVGKKRYGAGGKRESGGECSLS